MCFLKPFNEANQTARNGKRNMKRSVLQIHFGSLHYIREDNLSKAYLREFPFKTKDPLILYAIQTAETQFPRDRG